MSDITIRVTAPRGSDRASILGALWRARFGHELTSMQIQAIDWRHNERDFDYTGAKKVADAMGADGMGALLKHWVDSVELRVEPVA